MGFRQFNPTQRSNIGATEKRNTNHSIEKPRNARKTFLRILSMMKEYRIHLAAVVTLGLISSITSVAGTYFIRPIINNTIIPFIGHEHPDLSRLRSMLAALAIIYLIGAICNYFAQRIMVNVTSGTLREIRVAMFHHIQNLPIRYFDDRTHGEIMSHFTNDADTLREMIFNAIPNLVFSSISIIGMAIMMLILSWQLFLLVVVQLIIMFLIVRFVGKYSANFYIKQQRELGKINGYIEEMIEGQKVVKVFTHEKKVKKEFDALSENLFHVASMANLFAIILIPILGSLSFIHYAITATLGAILAIQGVLDIGAIGAFLQYTRSFTQPLNMIAQQINTILAALAGAERIFTLLDEPIEIDEGKIQLVNIMQNESGEMIETDQHTGFWAWKLPNGEQPDKIPLCGDVRFENVTFSYEPNQPVLSDISLFAKPGQKIAFVGSTGAGKTTIINLLNRFYDVDQGKITYDGIDIKEIRKDDLRKSISMVLQDTHLFTGTVAENIRYGNLPATEEDIHHAATLANANFFITHLPEGYQTIIESDGANLSQGQRQLLAISRAAVKDPPVLVLDEATSSIDTRTERLIEQGMDTLMQNRTVFVIAHRLSTVRNANAILVLEDGKIIERGDHNTLLEQKGRYYQLYTGISDLQ